MRSRAAHDLAFAAAREEEADILVTSEPNRALSSKPGWYTDQRGDAAAYLLNRRLAVVNISPRMGYLVLTLESVTLFICYCSPNAPDEEASAYLERVFREARRTKGDKVVLGDLNAKSASWGSPITDKRGREVDEWVAALDMVVLNRGGVPTFQRGDTTSFIDVTIANKRFANKITEWRVRVQECLSDHRHIVIGAAGPKRVRATQEPVRPVTNWKMFKEELPKEMRRAGETRWTHESLMRCVEKAHRSATARRGGRVAKAPYWWSDEIGHLRKRATDNRRRMTRAGTRAVGGDPRKVAQREEAEEQYAKAKADLKREIRVAKNRHWRDLVNRLEGDIWGDGYKIATKALVGHRPPPHYG